MNYLNQFAFGIYPYIALSIFLLGSLIRFDREQYSWKSESSQTLYRGNLRLGNILFHVGIIGLFFGHAVGLLTPYGFWTVVGITTSMKQTIAIVGGGIMGVLTLAGILILLHRRFVNDRLRAVTTFKDKVVLLWILATLLVGLATIIPSTSHMDGALMVQFMNWAQHIVTFRGGAASFVADAPALFKLHLFMGMSLFVIFPFTRLVHVWSGFGTVAYLGRAYQLVRPR
jgi:nitrate reductase gamma subunit